MNLLSRKGKNVMKTLFTKKHSEVGKVEEKIQFPTNNLDRRMMDLRNIRRNNWVMQIYVTSQFLASSAETAVLSRHSCGKLSVTEFGP